MKFFLQMFSILLVTACVATHSRVESFSGKGQCEAAEERIYQVELPAKLWGRTKQTLGGIVSVGAAGAGYAQDVFVILVGNVLPPVVLCTVAIPVDFLMLLKTGQTPKAMDACTKSLDQDLPDSSAGARLYDDLSGLRELDMTPLSRVVRSVAACYRRRGDARSMAHAADLLNRLRNNREIFAGLSGEERALVLKDLQDPAGKAPSLPEVPEVPVKPSVQSAKLSDTEKRFLGSWISDTGHFADGGTKPELTGKKIAGAVRVTITENTVEIDMGFADVHDIEFVSDPSEVQARFAGELKNETREFTLLRYKSSGIYELLLLDKDTTRMESVRAVTYYSNSAVTMKIRRLWEKEPGS